MDIRRILKRTASVVGCLLVGMQFVPTARKPENGEVRGVHMQEVVDPKVGAILDRSCADCHSNHTRWPWYSRIAPVSWILCRDVSKGRAKLDFSQWTEEPRSTNARMEICDAVSDRSMPLRAYTVLHRDARLSELDVDLICAWASSPVAQTPPGQINGATQTADRWQTSSNATFTRTKGNR